MFLKKVFGILAFGILANSVFCQDEQYPGCLDSLIIPTILTPTADVGNVTFAVHFPCVPEKLKVTICNRWGSVVFTSKNPGFQWYGQDAKGNNLGDGVYHYTIEFNYLNEEKLFKGQITLIR